MDLGIGDHFVFLAAESEAVSSSQLLTRPIGVIVRERDVLVGIDAAGEKHLLLPVRSDERVSDDQSHGVTVSVRRLHMHGSHAVYADLHCRARHLDLVFERLVEDVVTRLQKATGVDAVSVCIATLDDWRALLRTAGQALPHDAVVGLVGELEVLKRISARHPAPALDSWTGPAGSVHDFVAGARALEVKTTSSIDGKSVSISDLDQLDSALVDNLHLVVVHVRDNPTAPGVAERIDHLVATGTPRQALLERLQKVGYIYDMDLHDQDRLEVRSVRFWTVDETFPGLRRSHFSEQTLHAVTRVRYDLFLDAAPPPLTDDQANRVLSEWTQAS